MWESYCGGDNVIIRLRSPGVQSLVQCNTSRDGVDNKYVTGIWVHRLWTEKVDYSSSLNEKLNRINREAYMINCTCNNIQRVQGHTWMHLTTMVNNKRINNDFDKKVSYSHAIGHHSTNSCVWVSCVDVSEHRRPQGCVLQSRHMTTLINKAFSFISLTLKWLTHNNSVNDKLKSKDCSFSMAEKITEE